MSIGKEQLRDLLKASQPPGSEIRDILVKGRDGEESDFEDLVILFDMPIPAPGIREEDSQ